MTTSDDASALTAVQQRTRQTILASAVTSWARDFSAPIGDIADHARVSRSTVHRYFADRDALVAAAAEHAMEQLGTEHDGTAEAHDVSPIDQLEAWLRGAIRTSDAVLFLFSDPDRFAEFPGVWDDPAESSMHATVEKAQASGELNPDLPVVWVINHYYSIVYIAAELVTNGTLTVDRASELATTTWRHGVAAR